MVGVDDVDFASPDETFPEGGLLLDVIVGIPGKNGVRANAPVEKSANDPGGVLIETSPNIIVVATGEELDVDVDHILDVLMWMFYRTIDRQGIDTSVFNY